MSTGTSGAVTSTYNAGTGVWTASGAIADVNALLAGVTFNPAANFNGSFTIATNVSDGSLSVSGLKSVTGIAVNDAPVLTLPGTSVSTHEDTALALTGASVADPDTGDVITLNLSVGHGSLAPIGALPAGIFVDDGDGSDGTLQVHGSAVDVSALLAGGINYTPTPDYNGADTLTVAVHDAVGATDSKPVTITID